MSEIRIIPVCNAGVILYLQGLCIWIDVLNRENEGGYDVLSEEAFERLLKEPEFRPDAILFTHRHADHYSEERLFRAVKVFPAAKVFVGGGKPSPQHITLPSQAGSVMLHVLPLPHEGTAYQDVENDALLLTAPEGSVLIPGDCPVGCPELLKAIEKWRFQGPEKPARKLDLALLNFPWLSLGKGRKALLKLDPGHLFFFHLPSPETDLYGYRKQAERMLSLYRGDRDMRIAERPFMESLFQI